MKWQCLFFEVVGSFNVLVGWVMRWRSAGVDERCQRSLTDSSCFQELSMCCWARRPSWKCWNKRTNWSARKFSISIIQWYFIVDTGNDERWNNDGSVTEPQFSVRASIYSKSLRWRLSRTVGSCTHSLPLSLQLLGVSGQLADDLWVQVLSKFFSLSGEFVQLTKSCSKSQTPGVPVTANHTAGV